MSRIVTGFFRVVCAVGDALGVDLTIPLTQAISSDSPPWFTTLGLNVQRSEFEGMPVWTLQSANPSGKYVVAVHGGAFVVQPNIWNWSNYAAMARDAGATVIVPIYPLEPQGTAGTVVPAMADLISAQIDPHGAENVSVYGDSAGGNIALAAVQELVRRGDPVPLHMVLISPALDLTLSNPAIQFVDDPTVFGHPPDSAQVWPTLGRRPAAHRHRTRTCRESEGSAPGEREGAAEVDTAVDPLTVEISIAARTIMGTGVAVPAVNSETLFPLKDKAATRTGTRVNPARRQRDPRAGTRNSG